MQIECYIKLFTDYFETATVKKILKREKKKLKKKYLMKLVDGRNDVPINSK